MQASLPAALGEVHRNKLHGNLAHHRDKEHFNKGATLSSRWQNFL